MLCECRSAVQRRRAVGLLLALCLLLASSNAAEAYKYRFLPVVVESITSPYDACPKSYGGFPPNLYTPVRNEHMAAYMILGLQNANMHAGVSGTNQNSECTTSSRCVWYWNGGPLATAPVIFYIGNTHGIQQPSTYYHTWDTGFPRWYAYTLYYPIHVDFYPQKNKWQNSVYATYCIMFVCELIDTSDSSVYPESESAYDYGTVASGLPWWGALIIALIICIIVFVLVIWGCKCCANRDADDSYDDYLPPLKQGYSGNAMGRAYNPYEKQELVNHHHQREFRGRTTLEDMNEEVDDEDDDYEYDHRDVRYNPQQHEQQPYYDADGVLVYPNQFQGEMVPMPPPFNPVMHQPPVFMPATGFVAAPPPPVHPVYHAAYDAADAQVEDDDASAAEEAYSADDAERRSDESLPPSLESPPPTFLPKRKSKTTMSSAVLP